MTLCFLDTETSGLDIDRHEIWEVALITEEGTEHVWQLPVDLGRADPVALKVGQFYERRASPFTVTLKGDDGRTFTHTPGGITTLGDFARRFEALTRDVHLVGANVAFDAYRLEKLLKANGACPGWHYHLIDVEALMIGAIGWRARSMQTTNGDNSPSAQQLRDAITPPWKSGELGRQFGIDSEDPEFVPKHSALGDAKWVRACYYAVVGKSEASAERTSDG